MKDLDAERCFLGSIFLEPDAVVEYLETPPEVFQDVLHRGVWRAMRRLDSLGIRIDIVSIRRAMEDDGPFELRGGAMALMGLAESTPTAANIGYYAAAITNAWRIRMLRAACQKSISILESGGSGGSKLETLAEAMAVVLDQPIVSERRAPQLLGDVAARAVTDAAAGAYARGTTTGLGPLDDMTAGMHGSELIVLAGRPSMGKTTLALNILGSVAKTGGACLFASLEMRADQLALNLVAGAAGVNALSIRRQQLTDDEAARVDRASAILRESQVWIDDDSSCRAAPILRSRARRLAARRGGLSVIVIDYLQLLHNGRRRKDDNRNLELGEILGGLKALAKDLDCTVLILSQLSRGVESRPDKKPRLSDLRDSGSIEQDADQVWLLMRKEYYWPTKPEFRGLADVIVAKNRNGPTGTVSLFYEAESFRFRAAPRPGGGRV